MSRRRRPHQPVMRTTPITISTSFAWSTASPAATFTKDSSSGADRMVQGSTYGRTGAPTTEIGGTAMPQGRARSRGHPGPPTRASSRTGVWTATGSTSARTGQSTEGSGPEITSTVVARRSTTTEMCTTATGAPGSRTATASTHGATTTTNT
ncbi:hypothetical protein PR202_ga28259 [Eleusine coracana subsp. coracana]|uniref:Uncharacterized protein n=1 Tax=Eleusine coracana subsp. coracana TaxID=191504 RepID=A0AAV5DJ00_ELECO|nr:hypothetical protein PR202_ga28259 [Eleusine coracana subsp. coracana]